MTALTGSMKKIRRPGYSPAVLLLLALLTGCGQKGPLVLPADPAQEQSRSLPMDNTAMEQAPNA